MQVTFASIPKHQITTIQLEVQKARDSAMAMQITFGEAEKVADTLQERTTPDFEFLANTIRKRLAEAEGAAATLESKLKEADDAIDAMQSQINSYVAVGMWRWGVANAIGRYRTLDEFNA
ncbi:hypothetical protein HK101_011339 [Irineochytrium annulatum]|nr:hypothetical protein HK101_011339 [Irineochytrium annulatum]